jgi:hypothetical protein
MVQCRLTVGVQDSFPVSVDSNNVAVHAKSDSLGSKEADVDLDSELVGAGSETDVKSLDDGSKIDYLDSLESRSAGHNHLKSIRYVAYEYNYNRS